MLQSGRDEFGNLLTPRRRSATQTALAEVDPSSRRFPRTPLEADPEVQREPEPRSSDAAGCYMTGAEAQTECNGKLRLSESLDDLRFATDADFVRVAETSRSYAKRTFPDFRSLEPTVRQLGRPAARRGEIGEAEEWEMEQRERRRRW